MSANRTNPSPGPGRKDGVQLLHDRVKGRREECSLTQQAVGSQVDVLLHGANSPTTQESQLTTYQRIEASGKTSRKYAQALAKVLGTSVAVLQGDTSEDGPSLAKRVETQLRAQLASGCNPRLQTRLEDMRGDGDHVEWLAEDLALEIEEAMLPQRPAELARLAQLTGWSEREVTGAGAMLGHWMVVSALNRSSRITTGIVDALRAVKDECAEGLLQIAGSDVRIALTEELPWLRIEVSSPRWDSSGRLRLIFSLVRCFPSRKGLEYQNPTWRDRDTLDWLFQDWAFGNAEFVTFKGRSYPQDVSQLRLLVERHTTPDHAEEVVVHEGWLGHMSAESLEEERRTGGSHACVTRCLQVDLWDTLAPLLAGWPLEHWQVRFGSAISVYFDTDKIPMRVLLRTGQRPPRFAIRLVEADGAERRHAPWRLAGVEAAGKRLADQLAHAVASFVGPPHPEPWPV